MKGQASIAVTRAMPRALVKKKKDFKKNKQKIIWDQNKALMFFLQEKKPPTNFCLNNASKDLPSTLSKTD